ncbi:MAG: DUF6044 family protein, partial [Elusimicrobiota bacterium]
MAIEYVILGPFSFIPILDTADSTLPWTLMLAREGLGERLSLWLPSMACGLDRLSAGILDAHWLTWGFTLLPGWLAFQAAILAHLFLSAFFTFRIATEDLGLSETAGVFAGVYTAFGLALIISYQGAFHLLPFILWSLGRLSSPDRRAPWAWAAGLGLLYSGFSNVSQTLPFCLPAVIVWLGLFGRGSLPRRMALAAIFCACASAPHLPVAWALVDNAPRSHRADWAPPASQDLLAAFSETLLPPLQQLPAVLAVLAGLAAARRGRKTISRSFILLLLLYALCTAGTALLTAVKDAHAARLGFLRGFPVGRFAHLAPFLGALCAACGLDLLPRKRLVLWAAAILLAVSSLDLKIRHAETWLFQGSYAANYHSPAIRDLARKGGPGPFRVATFTHGMHPAYAEAYGLETVDGYPNMYPKTYQRFWSKVIEPLTDRDERYRRYFNEWGNRIYFFLESVESMPDGIPFQRYYRLDLLSLANMRYLISRHPLLHKDLIPILRQTPWHDLSRRERLWIRFKENFLGKSYLFIYENRACLPRAFFAPRVKVFDAGEDLLSALGNASSEELRRTAFVERPHWQEGRGTSFGA